MGKAIRYHREKDFLKKEESKELGQRIFSWKSRLYKKESERRL
jgi:hypothetical protein